MNIETKLAIAVEIARRAAVRSGMTNEDAILSAVLDDSDVAALLARPDVEKDLRLRYIMHVLEEDAKDASGPTTLAARLIA